MTKQNPYAAHSAFVWPARARAETWRICVVSIGVFVAFFLTPQMMASLAPSPQAVDSLFAATTPIASLMMLLSFTVTLAALILLVNRVHDRGLSTLVGETGLPRQTLWRVAFSVGLVLAVQEPLFLWLDWEFLASVRDFGRWTVWVLPGIFALLIQVSTEELFFRGYLQQQLAAQSSSRWVWMGAPSLIFALAHSPNALDPVSSAYWVFWAGMLGLACADLTARTGNLGAAIGLHLANNIFALLLIGVEGQPMSGLALFLYPEIAPEDLQTSLWTLLHPAMLFQFMLAALSIFVMWMAARLTLRL